MTAILRATPEFLPHEVVVAEELIDAFLTDGESSGYFIRVADLDGRVCGYVCFGETPLTMGTWDVYWIAVDGSLQGKGIGAALMKAAEDHIKTAGGRLINLETSGKAQYNKTRRFYQGLGYTEVARVPDFYDVDDDLVILTKQLR